MKIPAPWPLETQSPFGCLGAGPGNRCLWILPHGVQVAKGRLTQPKHRADLIERYTRRPWYHQCVYIGAVKLVVPEGLHV